MYTKQQQLEYLHRLQRLRQAAILKDDVHLTYIYRNRKKATHNIHTLQDKIQKEIVNETLNGNYPNRGEIRRIQRKYNFDSKVEEAVETLLKNERKRIHNQESKFIDHVVEQHSQQYTNFMKNRLTIEAGRIVEKVIVIEGQALESGAKPYEARQAAWDYSDNHGKARTRNIVKDAVHSQECNVSFIDAIENEYRYKVWMNGRSKGKTRAWHVARTISPMPIDEPFRIRGPYGVKDVMYPGDLNGGAENVANCRCWLRYTNRKPDGVGQTFFNIPESSYLHTNTRKISVQIRDAFSNLTSNIKEQGTKIKNKIFDVGSSIRSKFKLR